MKALREAGPAPPIFPTIGELWKDQGEKRILTKKMTLMSTKIKAEISTFVLHDLVTFPRLSIR